MQQIAQRVAQRGARWKGAGQVFKDAGRRAARIVALQGRACASAELLVSSLPRSWDLIGISRQRAAIGALFRDWKSSGRRWEASQVRDPAHQEHLAAGLGLATLITLVAGVQAAEAERRRPARRRPSRSGRQSLFTLGRAAFWQRQWRRDRPPPLGRTDLEGRDWSAGWRARHALAGADIGRRAAWRQAHWNARNRQKAHIFCPPLNSHTGGRRSLGVLKPKTREEMQGLPKKPAPVRLLFSQ